MLNAGQPSTEDIFRLQKSCLCLNIPHFHDSIEYETLLPCKTLLIAKSGKEIKFLSPCYARRKRKKLGTQKQLQEGKQCCKVTKNIAAAVVEKKNR